MPMAATVQAMELDDGHLGDAAEARDAKGLGHRRDDEAAGRQAHEEHERRDVEAPRAQIAHAGLHHAARELHTHSTIRQP